MKALLKLLQVFTIIGLGWLGYAFTANLLVSSGMLTADQVSTSFGVEMTHKAMLVWMIAIPLSVWSVFLKTPLRFVLFFAPLYGPSLFAVIYTLINRGEVSVF